MSEITRTITTRTAVCTAVKNENGKKTLESVTVCGIPAKYDSEEKALRFVKKSNPAVAMIDELTEVTALYAMTEEDFSEKAIPAKERSKETRDTISKELFRKIAVCTVVTKERTLVEECYSIPNRFTDTVKACNYCRKHYGNHIISVDEIRLEKQLAYMTIADFIANAEVRPLREVKSK